MLSRTCRFALVILAVCLGVATSHSAEPVQVGAAAVDITPVHFPINMPGGFRANFAQQAHDPFYSRAIVISDGSKTVAMVVVDNLGVDPAVIEAAKQKAAAATKIRPAHMMVCSTHTHSGPPSNANADQPIPYRQRLTDGIASSIEQAHANLQPAAIGFAKHPLAEEVFNRRWFLKPGKMPTNPFGEMDQVKMNPSRSPGVLDRPAGPTDPDISILSVQDRRGKPLALFANYSLHYVGAIPKGQLSADYFGEFARLMPNRLRAPEGFVAMMSNGTSGDINNIPFGVTRPPREPFEQVRIVARKAADTAWTAYQKIERHQASATVDMRERVLTLRYRRPTAQQVAFAEKVLATKEEKAIAALPRLAPDYARRTLRAANRKEETVDVKLQAIRIGDIAICAIPFETIVEIGLELKLISPFPNTFVVGLANGRYGYLPTPAQHRLGGYETWLGTNQVQKDASDLIVANLKEMLAELKETQP